MKGLWEKEQAGTDWNQTLCRSRPAPYPHLVCVPQRV